MTGKALSFSLSLSLPLSVSLSLSLCLSSSVSLSPTPSLSLPLCLSLSPNLLSSMLFCNSQIKFELILGAREFLAEQFFCRNKSFNISQCNTKLGKNAIANQLHIQTMKKRN